MYPQRLFVILQTLLLLVLSSCVEPEETKTETVQGFRPVYGSNEDMKITWMSPQSVKDPGKIYVYGPYLLVNEVNAGIHVYDNSNPADPRAIGFIQLLGNTDMAIKDGVLYADHGGDLVAITLADFSSLRETGRIALNTWTKGVPPPRGYSFECVDSEKGFVVSWEKAELTNPQCYALQ